MTDWAREHSTVVIFFIAFSIRLATSAAIAGWNYKPVGDALDYVTIAENLVAGRGFATRVADLTVRPTARRPPLFPLLLAGSFLLFGTNFVAPRVLLALIGSLSCVLLAKLGCQLVGNRQGVLCGFAAALLPGMWINDTILMSESVYVCLLLAFVLLAERSVHYQSKGTLMTLGVLAGLLALTRPEGILLWWLLAAWILFVRPPRHPWKVLATVLAIATIVMSPWIVRNFVRFQAFIPSATSVGQVLACANNDRTYREFEWKGGLVLDPIDPTKNLVYRRWLADRTINEAEMNTKLKWQGLHYMRAHLRELPQVMIWRLRRTFDLWPARRSAMHEIGEGRSPIVQVVIALLFPPILLAAFLGGAGSVRQIRELFWPYALIVFYIIDVTVSWGSPRFRSPIEPFIILFAVRFGTRFFEERN